MTHPPPTTALASPDAEPRRVTTQDCVSAVRIFIEDFGIRPGERLPPERHLAETLNVTRGRLRQALSYMVREGVIWRHVGKGTFLSAGVATNAAADNNEAFLPPPFDRTNPLQLLEARLVVEPRLAAMAALRGTHKQFLAIQEWKDKGKSAEDYASSQHAGDGWHLSVAEAAQSELLLWVFKQLFHVRNFISWGRLSADLHPADDARVWREHEMITAAICTRYAAEAERLMRLHLESLRSRIQDLI